MQMSFIQYEDIENQFVITALIHDHRNGHCVTPNKVALEYHDFITTKGIPSTPSDFTKF